MRRQPFTSALSFHPNLSLGISLFIVITRSILGYSLGYTITKFTLTRRLIFQTDVPDNPDCETLFPVVDELAMRYRDNKTVTIAVMDVSKNDADIDVHMEYPSFRLFTADNKVRIIILFALIAAHLNCWYFEVKALKGEKSLRTMKAFIDANGAPNFMV